MSFVSRHILQEIQVIWCKIPFFGEVAVEAIQMKVQSDVSVQMTLGNCTKVLQITYLTARCRRAHQDDQNGHLNHPIRSPDRKVTPPGKSPTRPCQAGRPDLGRPAWNLPKTLATHHHILGDSLMDPQTLGRQARNERKTERPHMPL